MDILKTSVWIIGGCEIAAAIIVNYIPWGGVRLQRALAVSGVGVMLAAPIIIK